MTDNEQDNSTEVDYAAIWQNAPTSELVPFLSREEKDSLAESGEVVAVTAMIYVRNSQYGPRFGATVILPTGEERYMTMKSAGGTTPRDKTNRWLFDMLKDEKVRHIPAVLVRHGQAYSLEQPPQFTA
ncbi:MAG: hypothetical protein ACRD0E_07670 [Acidimicrobiales bacterium]